MTRKAKLHPGYTALDNVARALFEQLNPVMNPDDAFSGKDNSHPVQYSKNQAYDLAKAAIATCEAFRAANPDALQIENANALETAYETISRLRRENDRLKLRLSHIAEIVNEGKNQV